MRIVVVGGTGNFGARIVRALRTDPNIELLVAGRRIISVPAAEDVPGVLVDIDEGGFAQGLKDLSPGLVIHCVGPFQGQDYRVSNAALAAGAHYLDLADGRRFITEFAAGMNDHAVRVSRVAISGASTLPALSSAVVEELRVGLSSLESMFDAGAGEKGGMRVSVVGNRSDSGGRVRRTWQLTAPAMDGPEIPCMAAILLARRLARGEVFKSGAFPCMGFLTLSEFAPEFARWKITTRIEEVPA